jgi:hypothetical protein
VASSICLCAKIFKTLNRLCRHTVYVGIEHPFKAHDQIFLFSFFFWTIPLLFVLGRPLWREDGSVICSAICQWSESRRTHNHTLLSHLRLLGSLSVISYDSQGLQWKYSNPPPHGDSLREDGSVIYSAISKWSESRRTHNRTLLSHLRLLGSPSVASYDSQALRWKYP